MTEYHAAQPRRRTRRRLAEGPQPDEPAWVKQARHLRRNLHWSYQHIADELLSTGAIDPSVARPAAYRRVYKALNRERVRQTDKRHSTAHAAEKAAYDKQRVNAAAPDCSICGAKLYRPPKILPPVCRRCRLRAGQRNKAAVAGLALLGWTGKEISEHLGIPASSASTTIAQLRREGMPIPRRRRKKAE